MSGIGAICVGGPLGGQRKHILHGSSFRVCQRVPLPLPMSLDMPLSEVLETHPITKEIKYVTQDWHTEEGTVKLWVPERQTPSETLAILLTTYEAQQRKTRP